MQRENTHTHVLRKNKACDTNTETEYYLQIEEQEQATNETSAACRII